MAPALQNTSLFKPLKVGNAALQTRVVLLPMTRNRNSDDHTPTDLMLEYYQKRTRFPGTLAITEAILVSEKAGLYANVPGLWADKHVEGWKKIVDAVHANGSFISAQLWALGRVGDPVLLKEKGHDLTSSSPLYESEGSKKKAEEAGNPVRELTEEEIKDLIYNQFTKAAKNAVAAGFDILEIHGATGYLIEQFLNPSSNKRTDKYGGSIENRARFALELVDHLISVVGANKVAIRISPFSVFQGMLGENESIHPIVTFGYLLDQLQKRAEAGNELAYISIVDGRFSDDFTEAPVDNTFTRQVWKGKIVRGGNYTYDLKDWKDVQNDVKADSRTLIGFGRHFLANPDLPYRLQKGQDLNKYDRETFYSGNIAGYNTYPDYGEMAKHE